MKMPVTASGRMLGGHVSEGLWGHFRNPERVLPVRRKVGGSLKRAMSYVGLCESKSLLSDYDVPGVVLSTLYALMYRLPTTNLRAR